MFESGGEALDEKIDGREAKLRHLYKPVDPDVTLTWDLKTNSEKFKNYHAEL